MQQSDIAMVALAAVTAVAVGVGIYAVGGPEYARKSQRDEVRFEQLQQLAPTVECLAIANNGKLPEAIDPAHTCAQSMQLTDAVTNVPFVFVRTSASTYQLCAGFETDLVWRRGFDQGEFDPATGCINYRYPLYR